MERSRSPPAAPSLLGFDGDGSAATRLDLLSLSPDNPLFADADRDGMPDEWERARGLDPEDAADANRAAKPGGYTNIENYLHSIGAKPAGQAKR